jgi:hypothetical protein
MQLLTIIFEKIAEVSQSSCRLKLRITEKKNAIAELQLWTNIFLKVRSDAN